MECLVREVSLSYKFDSDIVWIAEVILIGFTTVTVAADEINNNEDLFSLFDNYCIVTT